MAARSRSVNEKLRDDIKAAFGHEAFTMFSPADCQRRERQ
jgi:hypothetical protein